MRENRKAHPDGHRPSRGVEPSGLAASRSSAAGTPNEAGRAGGLGPERVIEIQRARILGAMVEVSAERGAANVTVAHVVERAGVSRRTFYELYSDREECFLAAFDNAVARLSRHVLDAYDPDAKWVERVRTALTAVLQFLDVERGAGQLLIVASLGAGHNALERRRGGIAQIIALLDEGGNESKTGAELPPLTAEGIVGGVLSVLHARLLHNPPSLDVGDSRTGPPSRLQGDSLLALAGPLMSMIVLPYLGPAAARRELKRPAPLLQSRLRPASADPLRDVRMRLTYRTVRVLTALAELGGQGADPSNREIGLASGMHDQGQISKLLTRLARLGLIENGPAGRARGAPNAWVLTDKGAEIERAVGERAS
jgi:AcrR family transcriptional regulator